MNHWQIDAIKRRKAYLAYMASPEWVNKREQVFALKGRKCELCGSVNHIEVHHLTYWNLGKENMDELMPLCKPCHKKAHKHGGGYIGVDYLKKQAALKEKQKDRKPKVQTDPKKKKKKVKNPLLPKPVPEFTPRTVIRKSSKLNTSESAKGVDCLPSSDYDTPRTCQVKYASHPPIKPPLTNNLPFLT